ncbi:hypothetical protein BH23GEM4_BH23GEM4_10110 [soil metagenome]
MKRDDRRMTFIVVPQGEGDLSTRSFEVTYRRLRIATILAGLVLVALLAMAGTWWYVAAQAARVPGLEGEIVALQRDRQRVAQLERVLARMERQYEQVRIMLGAEAPGPPPEAVTDSVAEWIPGAWPLPQRGYVTRGPGGAGARRHPGLDIAVATGTPVRAVGPGTVVEAGEDSVYGRYLRIDHGDGYTSLYGHASLVLVRRGDRVRRAQEVAVSGNTGLSTAPHLHLEIRRGGEPLDPRSVLQIPG